MEQFKNEWITFIKKDGVCIFPLTLTEDERDQRRNHIFKLSGFHAGTLVRDLLQILENVKATSIFISRHPGTYKTLNPIKIECLENVRKMFRIIIYKFWTLFIVRKMFQNVIVSDIQNLSGMCPEIVRNLS